VQALITRIMFHIVCGALRVDLDYFATLNVTFQVTWRDISVGHKRCASKPLRCDAALVPSKLL
jgi:hypothetical protein